MTRMSYSFFLGNPGEHLRRVSKSKTPLTIETGVGKSVTVVPTEMIERMKRLERELEALEGPAIDETDYLLSNPANARILEESIAELNAGRGIERDPTL